MIRRLSRTTHPHTCSGCNKPIKRGEMAYYRFEKEITYYHPDCIQFERDEESVGSGGQEPVEKQEAK